LVLLYLIGESMTALEYVNNLIDTDFNESQALEALINSHRRLYQANEVESKHWRNMPKWKRWLLNWLDK